MINHSSLRSLECKTQVRDDKANSQISLPFWWKKSWWWSFSNSRKVGPKTATFFVRAAAAWRGSRSGRIVHPRSSWSTMHLMTRRPGDRALLAGLADDRIWRVSLMTRVTNIRSIAQKMVRGHLRPKSLILPVYLVGLVWIRSKIAHYSSYSVTLLMTIITLLSGPDFRRSEDKTSQELEFVPVNLHLQRMWAENDSLRKSAFYDIITHGAFTSIPMKSPGLIK